MKGNILIRIGKGVALLGFVLPWVVVSCSGQPVAKATGLSLAMGQMSTVNPTNGVSAVQHGTPDLWILLALAVVIAGLIASFVKVGRDGARYSLMAAAGAALLSIIGVATLHGSIVAAASKSGGENGAQQLGAAAANAFQVNIQYGFWITLLGLSGAAGAAFMILTGREGMLQTAVASIHDPVAKPNPKPADDDDTAFWDKMGDKNDVDQLHEYLIRFPEGRFRTLALSKLERAGVQPLMTSAENPPAPRAEPEIAAAPSVPGKTCVGCEAPLADAAAFCTECGKAVTA